MEIRGIAQNVADFKRPRFLALNPIGVDMIDNRNRVLVADFAGEHQRIIKRAFNRDHFCPVNKRLGQFAQRNIGVGQQYDTLQSRARGIGRRRRTGIAGGRAHDCPCAFFDALWSRPASCLGL